jgi:hypothetical protein
VSGDIVHTDRARRLRSIEMGDVSCSMGDVVQVMGDASGHMGAYPPGIIRRLRAEIRADRSALSARGDEVAQFASGGAPVGADWHRS